MLKRIVVFSLLFFVFMTSFIKAEEMAYVIADVSSGHREVVASYRHYEEAAVQYKRLMNQYANLVLYENDEVLKMEYGLVAFKSDGACSLKTVYYSDTLKKEAFLNGCYGADALFLKTGKNDQLVYFMLAGDEGHISRDQVDLLPFELLRVRPSAYRVEEGFLYHDIKGQMNSDFYSRSLLLDYSTLADGVYYSYDGHYFFNDFYDMSDAVADHNYEKAVNEEAYYNYFQYLPYRSRTNYALEELEYYFNDVLGITNRLDSYRDANKDGADDCLNRSQLYGNYVAFTTYQDIYGANALMMLAQACNESAYGRSALSYMQNNLFSHAAFNSDEERNSGRYGCVADGVYAYARYYVSGTYANYRSGNYYGTYLGNKAGGMNVMYSADPYWGEKTAANCFIFDRAMGQRDYNDLALGIVDEDKTIAFYRDNSLTSLLYKYENRGFLSLILLKEEDDCYLVQLDPSFSEDNVYDPQKALAYIEKDVVDEIRNGEKIRQKEYQELIIDGGGGTIKGHEQFSIKVEPFESRSFVAAEKDGYEFAAYKSEDGKTYRAEYRQIDRLEVVKPIKRPIEYGGCYDLKGAEVRIFYSNGQKRLLPINTDMVGSFDNEDASVQVVPLTYGGEMATMEVEVSKEPLVCRQEIMTILAKEELNDRDIEILKADLLAVDYHLAFADIRKLDNVGSALSVVVEENDCQLSVSGLNFAFASQSFLFKNILYVQVARCQEKNRLLINDYARAYGFEECRCFALRFHCNYQNVEPLYPLVISLEADKNDVIYSVYHVNKDGDVIKCQTRQSANYVYFIAEESGDYVLLEKDCHNIYALEDVSEHFTWDNSEPDHLESIKELFSIIVVGLWGSIQIVYDSFIKTRSEELWKESRKSLQTAAYVQEEKLKN